MIFDGRKEAEKIRKELLVSGKLNGKSLLIVQADGGRSESVYVKPKRQMGESLGVTVKTQKLENAKQVRDILDSKEIKSFNGVLVQLPIVGIGPVETQEILDLIPPEKDVDGLGKNAKFLPAVVKAVGRVLTYARGVENLRFVRVAVVGAAGMMGKRLVKWLKRGAFVVKKFDKGSSMKKLVDHEVIVSATGKAGLIRGKMVGDGIVAVDLGYPQGDLNFEEVRTKAKMITPVPGGVGPLTIVSLFDNLAQT